MKAVILAGGSGTRISEETQTRPKPMVEIGGRPILWHILKIYSHYGINDFIICCGFKGYFIKEYFSNYFLHMSDVTFDLSNNSMDVHQKRAENWKITLVDTGEDSMTGGRLLRVKDYLDEHEPFCFTYGDGVSDVDIGQSIQFHIDHGKLATVTAVTPTNRFGALEISDNQVTSFQEKPVEKTSLINGGFFVLSKKVLDYLENDQTIWEQEPLRGLTQDGQLMSFKHDGFWHPMDTLRDKNYLESLWQDGKAPWRVWK